MGWLQKLVLLTLFVGLITGCERVITWATPQKKAIVKETHLSIAAENTFWQTLASGDYNNIPHSIELLTAAYMENPYNPQISAHLGFLYLWVITERARLPKIPATIINNVILSQHFFEDAVILDPKNPIYLGFWGDAMLVTAHIFKDQTLAVRGYFRLKKAIRLWPEFNYFAAGFPLSILPVQDNYFQEALIWQWKTLELCAGHYINKKNPDFKPYLHRETQQGPLRACWNSKIAPHNFEGFFLNMGDMIVKTGDTETAIKIYQNAKLVRSYNDWPFKAMLEDRILHAKDNVTHFRNNNLTPPDKTMLFNGGFGCVVCHQAK